MLVVFDVVREGLSAELPEFVSVQAQFDQSQIRDFFAHVYDAPIRNVAPGEIKVPQAVFTTQNLFSQAYEPVVGDSVVLQIELDNFRVFLEEGHDCGHVGIVHTPVYAQLEFVAAQVEVPRSVRVLLPVEVKEKLVDFFIPRQRERFFAHFPLKMTTDRVLTADVTRNKTIFTIEFYY